MQSFQQDRLWLIQALRDEELRRTESARRFTTPGPSIRRTIGTSIVRFGTRLAGDAPYELARSR